MKKITLLIIILLFSHCSFDNKTGIWENSGSTNTKKTDIFKDFETLYTKEKSFNETIAPNKNLDLLLDPMKTNSYLIQKN